MRIWITHVCSNFVGVQEGIVSQDAVLQMDALPALECWERVLESLTVRHFERRTREEVIPSDSHSANCVSESVDHVPHKIPNS